MSDNFRRLSIGLDSLFNTLNQSSPVKYPPYDIIQEDDSNYCIQIAAAGFSKDDIEITQSEGTLTVSANTKSDSKPGRNYIYTGIARRGFSHSWALDKYLEVTGATFIDGILTVTLERIIPDKDQPKRIKII